MGAPVRLESFAERLKAAANDPEVADEIVDYQPCMSAVEELAPSHGPRQLISAAIHLAMVSYAVPWALSDWSTYQPAISDLHSAYRLLPPYSEKWAIPYRGLHGCLVWSGLRRHSNHQPYDLHARALMVSLWARRMHAVETGKQEMVVLADQTLPLVKNWIWTLNDERFRPKRDLPLSTSMQDSNSVEDFAVAVALHHLHGAERHREELTQALAVGTPIILGLPALIDSKKPKKPRSPRGEKKRPSDEPPTTETVIKISRIKSPLADDPPTHPEDEDEDSTTISHTKRNPSRKAPHPSLRKMLAWRRRAEKAQRVTSAGGLFARPHNESLLSSEARAVAKHSTNLASEALKTDIVKSAAHILITLTLCTGLTPQRVASYLARNNKRPLPKIDDATILIASMLPEAGFTPTEEHAHLFEQVEDSLTLPLPATVKTALSASLLYRNSAVLDHALTRLGPAINELRQRTGNLAISIGRIRKTYAVEIFEKSGNFCTTSFLSQDTFAQSTAPLHYYSTQSDILIDIYRRAIWSLFDDTYSGHGNSSARIGSKAVPRSDLLKEQFTRKPAAVLQQVIDRSSLESVVTAQNAMVTHVGAILMAIGGHRPSNSLFRLRRWDFDLELCAANFSDKQSDPAHIRRIAGLGEKGNLQIYLYLRHLRELADLNLNPKLTAYIRNQVLKGRKPMLFRLSADGSVRLADLQWFRKQIKKAPELPLNFGRHVLASHARSLDVSHADLLGIHLGHYESTGQPFSTDSPLITKNFLAALNPILDQIFHLQGWRLNTGLADPEERRRKIDAALLADWSEVGPLVSWENRKKAFDRVTNARNRKVRAHWRAQLHAVQHEAHQKVVDTAFELSPDLAKILAYRINERQHARLKQHAKLVHLSRNIKIPEVQSLPQIGNQSWVVEELLTQLDESYANDSHKSIAAHNAVARTLMWAHDEGIYSGEQHWPFLPLKELDPSPFLPGLFRASSQIALIRRAFDSQSEGHSGPHRDLAMAALSAVVFAGVDRVEVLVGIFKEVGKCRRIPAFPDTVLVHINSLSWEVGLRGPTAVCYARWLDRHQPIKDGSEIVEALRETFSCDPWVAGENLLERLTSTMEMVNRIERCGAGNQALSLDEGSTCLEPEQVDVLLGYAAPDADLEIVQSESRSLNFKEADHPPLNEFVNKVTSEMKHLRSLVSRKQADIELPETGQTYLYDRVEKESEKQKLIAELQACSDLSTWSWYGVLWARWLKNEITRPKKQGSGTLTRASVQNYYGPAEKELTRALKKRISESQRVPGPEDLENLYHSALEATSSADEGSICSKFLNLHEIAVGLFSIDDVDASDYWEYWRPSRHERRQVRNRIASDYEIETISNALLDHCNPGADLSAFVNQDRRTILQATLAFHLAVVSGARINEILSRHTIDFLLLGQETALMIRPNWMRRGKTRAAHRLIDLSERIDPIYRQLLEEQLQAEQATWPSRKQRRLWLFSTLDGRPTLMHRIRSIVNQVSLQTIGRTFRWHDLRHRWACDQYTQFTFGVTLSELKVPCHPDKMPHSPVQTPRQLATIRHSIGHSRHKMTISTYLHVPWIFQVQAQQWEWTPRRLAACLDIKVKTAGAILSREKGSARHTARLLARWVPTPDEIFDSLTHPNAKLAVKQSNARYCHALHDLGRGRSQDYVRARYALTQHEIARMLQYAHVLAEKSGIGIGIVGKPAQKRLSTPPKSTPELERLMAIWEAVESDQSESEWHQYLSTWYDFLIRGRNARRRVRWPVNHSIPVIQEGGPALEEKLEQRDTIAGSYSVSIQSKDVTTAYTWIMAIAWITDKARNS